MNASDIVRRQAALTPHAPAFIDARGHGVTYAQLAAVIDVVTGAHGPLGCIVG